MDNQDDEYDFLECAICLSTMSDIVIPFSINSREGNKACRHGFCLVCLAPYYQLQKKKIAENKAGTGTIDCPVCREPFDGFIVNNIANKLFETSKKYLSATKILKNELEIQKQEYDKQIEELEKKESDNSEILETLKTLEREKSQYQHVINHLEDKVKDKEYQLENEKNHHREATNQFQNRIKELTMKVETLEGSYNNQSMISKQMEGQLDLLSTQNRELVQKTQTLEYSIQTVQGEKRAAIERMIATDRKSNEFQRQLDEKNKTIQDQLYQLEKYRAALDSARNDQELQRRQYEYNLEENSKSGEKINDLEGALSCVKVEQCKLENQIEMLRKKNRSLEKEIEELHQKNSLSPSSMGGSPLNSISSFIGKSSDSYIEMFKKTPLSSLIAGVTGGAGHNKSEFIALFKELNIGEQRGSNKNSLVKKVTVPKVGQSVMKQIKYQVPTGLASFYSSGSPLDQDTRAFRESMLLYRMNHPNIVKLEKITKDDNGRFYAIISPFVECDLDYVLASKRAKSRIVPAVELKFVAYQLLAAINYLHSQEVVHRDIRPTSILVYEDYQVRLCSFSLACSILIAGGNGNGASNNYTGSTASSSSSSTSSAADEYNDEFVNISTSTTTTSNNNNGIIIPPFNNYSPPEILMTSGLTQTKAIDWKAVDMWAVGCVLAEMALSISQSTQASLFIGMDRNGLLKQICNLKECCPVQGSSYFTSQKIGGLQVNPTKSLSVELQPPIPLAALSPTKSPSASDTVTRDYIDLISQLLKFDPNQRISAKDALHHRFFSKESYYQSHPLVYDDIASSLTDRNINQFIKEKGII